MEIIIILSQHVGASVWTIIPDSQVGHPGLQPWTAEMACVVSPHTQEDMAFCLGGRVSVNVSISRD